MSHRLSLPLLGQGPGRAAGPTRLVNPPAAEPFFSAMPRDVAICVTGRCQLRCHHCFNESGPDNRHELPLAVIERVLDEMLGWGVRFLRLSGGEPTVHREFRAILDACARRGIKVAMNSHGVYPTDLLAYLKDPAASGALDLFMISLDGLEANNDAIRGPGVFRRAVQSCRELRAAARRVMVCCHVGAANRGDVGGLVALAAEIGADAKFSPIRPIGRAAREMPGAVARPEDYLAVVAEVTALRPRYPHINILTDFDILGGAGAADGDEAPAGPPTGECRRDPASASCKAGRTMVNIHYDGGIYPCAFFVTDEGEFSAGNVYRQSVGEVWGASPVLEPFRVHQKDATCQSCGHYARTCVGGCPAIAHATTGALDAMDPTCFTHLLEPAEGGLVE